MQKKSYLLEERCKSMIHKGISGISLFAFMQKVVPYAAMQKMISKQVSDSQDIPPKLYNQYGEEVWRVYLSTKSCKYGLTAGRTPRYFIWDHYDIALPIHFYGYIDIKSAQKDKYAKCKCLYLLESREIIPKVYKYILSHQEEIFMFDFIFTPDSEILAKFTQAKFCPASGLWYGTSRWGGVLDETHYNRKTKMVSILASYKVRCPLHQFRYQLAMKYKSSGTVDAFGTFDGGSSVEPQKTLDEYRYSIVIENQISPNYFTEKIMNCFAAMTVPIYVGAINIGDFFNAEGIISVKEPTVEAVEEALKRCSEADYASRTEAIQDNFRRVQKYLCPEDYIYQNYEEIFSRYVTVTGRNERHG